MKKIVEQLIHNLKHGGCETREIAAKSLGKQRSNQAIASLIAALADKCEDVPRAAASALIQIGHPALDALIAALENQNATIRSWAAYSLGRIGDSRSIDPLLVTLNDREPTVRGEAVRALSYFDDPRSIDPLLAVLNDEIPFVRIAAIRALSHFDDSRIVDPLLSMLKDSNWNVLGASVDALGKFNAPRATAALQSLHIHILVAEDERDIRELIGFSLQFSGNYKLLPARNGAEVVRRATLVHPDLILMDVRMPLMTGYEACERLKGDPETRDIPVVFLSAKGQESEIQEGLAVGAIDYFLKPFAPDELTENIKRIFREIELGIYD